MPIKKLYKTIEELMENELNTKEDPKAIQIMKSLTGIRRQGYFTKDEFVRMCMWKSPRQKRNYLRNPDEKIKAVSKKVLSTKYERRRIDLLTSLHGVSIPTASAILMFTDATNYGVIDIRVWKVLYRYGSVKVKPSGANFNFNNWYNYLMKLRYYAKRFNVKARDIERTLFFHHRKVNKARLYKIWSPK